MNVCPLPTNTFSVAMSISEANVYGFGTYDDPQYVPLGGPSPTPGDPLDYLFIAWCPSLTAYYGTGDPVTNPGAIPSSDKVGGFVMKQLRASDLETPWINRGLFDEILSSYSMTEIYSSDMTGFSSGGFVWASEIDLNILCPAANLIGSYFTGTIEFGQLPAGQFYNPGTPVGTGLSLKELIRIAGDTKVL